VYKRALTLGLVILASRLALAEGDGEGCAEPPRVVSICVDRSGFHPRRVGLVIGRPVILRFAGDDTTRHLLVPGLGLDVLLKPGAPTEVPLTPDETGLFRSSPGVVPGVPDRRKQLIIDVDVEPIMGWAG